MTVIALREKLASAVLLVALLVTLIATRRQQVEDVHREFGVTPRPPTEAALRKAFPVEPLALEALQRTAEVGTYAPLIEQDPFVRVKIAATGDNAAQTAPTASAAAAPSELILRGRVMLRGRQAAVVEVVTSHETLFVGVGQEIDGWKVVDIDEERVVLSKPPDQQLTLRLADDAARQGH